MTLNLIFDIFVSKIQKEADDSLLKFSLVVVDTNYLVNIVIVMFIVNQLGSKVKTEKIIKYTIWFEFPRLMTRTQRHGFNLH